MFLQVTDSGATFQRLAQSGKKNNSAINYPLMSGTSSQTQTSQTIILWPA